MRISRYFLLPRMLSLAIMLVAFIASVGQTVDDEQADVRLCPEMETDSMPQDEPLPTITTFNYHRYPFLHLKANHINLNGADWSRLQDLFAAHGDTVISIVHVGDSHIQAEGSTTRTRSLLQRRYGSAGRGLISPLRIIGSNQPLDYAITTTANYEKAWMMRMPWPLTMGFTGVAFCPKNKEYDIKISINRREGSEPDFDFVKIYGHGAVPLVLSVTDENGKPTVFNDYVVGDTLALFLYEPLETAVIKFQNRGQYTFFGFLLENQMTGVEYSAIGNNGATYSRYNELGSFAKDMSVLRPDLVIVSLGANEAFGKVSNEEFYSQIHRMVADIKKHNPQAEILLTTPQDCQRAKTVRTGKGKRRRSVKTYSVNANIPRLRDVMLRYGRENQIATYDWYDVAGGASSSNKWLSKNLMKKDRIHNTWEGYGLQGSLLYDALIETIEQRATK